MKKLKRVLAVVGIVLILSMYVTAFVTAFMDPERAGGMFRGAIACTIIVPVFLYLVMMVARLVSPEKSAAVSAVILSSEHVLHDADGAESWYAEELLKGLRRHGYKVHPVDSFDRTALQRILSEDRLTADKVLFLDSDPETVKTAQSLGCAAYVFTDYADAQADLAKIGIVWTR